MIFPFCILVSFSVGFVVILLRFPNIKSPVRVPAGNGLQAVIHDPLTDTKTEL